MSILIILSSLVSAVVLSFVIFILAFYHWRRPSHRKLCRKIPSPKMLSIFGIGIDLVKLEHSEILNYIGNLRKQHGPVVYIEYVGLPNVILTEPQDIELILSNSQHITKGLEYSSIIPWLCEGLLTSTETAMGMTLDFQLGEASEYVAAIKKAGEIILKRSLTFWMINEILFQISPTGREFRKSVGQLHRFTEKVIKDRKESYQPNYAYQEETEIGKQKQRKSFLDCLIEVQRENPNEMTDLGIREEVDTFMFEGYDTTSMAIMWTLFMIACHEDVQTKLREEIQQVFKGDSERDATLQDLHQLNYLEMVIKETLRLYPSVPYFSRLLTTDIKIRDYQIPYNTNISIVPYLVHRNPEVFPDPEKFIPERFLPEVVKERHPFAYIPFSAGYRNCIGQKFAVLEEKVVISTILRKLKLSTEMKKEEVKVSPQVILRPDPKIKITFTPY